MGQDMMESWQPSRDMPVCGRCGSLREEPAGPGINGLRQDCTRTGLTDGEIRKTPEAGGSERYRSKWT